MILEGTNHKGFSEKDSSWQKKVHQEDERSLCFEQKRVGMRKIGLLHFVEAPAKPDGGLYVPAIHVVRKTGMELIVAVTGQVQTVIFQRQLFKIDNWIAFVDIVQGVLAREGIEHHKPHQGRHTVHLENTGVFARCQQKPSGGKGFHHLTGKTPFHPLRIGSLGPPGGGPEPRVPQRFLGKRPHEIILDRVDFRPQLLALATHM